MNISQKIEQTVRTIPDFPKKGIMFKDITPLLENWQLSDEIIESFAKNYSNAKIDAIVGVESRGFLYGMMLANRMQVPFVTVRKKGKLPYKTVTHKYDLEYGSAEVEMHIDSIQTGWNVLVHDDLLATGGTAAAAAELVKMQGGKIAGFCFIIELGFLNGRKTLENYSKNIVNLISY